MQPIPAPQVLDPNRVLGHNADTEFLPDDRSETELLRIALQESCSYAQQLWHELDQVRTYLTQSLPPDPYESGASTVGAHPCGPDDDEGWRNWTTAFAGVTSILCGPHGDSGYGHSEATRMEHQRRVPPIEQPPDHCEQSGPDQSNESGEVSGQAPNGTPPHPEAGSESSTGRRLLLFLVVGGVAMYRLLRRHGRRPA
jgi:hypothetical protein